MKTEQIEIRKLVSLSDFWTSSNDLLPITAGSFYSGKAKGRYPFATNIGPDGLQSRFVWIDIDMLREYKILRDGTARFLDVFKTLEQLAAPNIALQMKLISINSKVAL